MLQFACFTTANAFGRLGQFFFAAVGAVRSRRNTQKSVNLLNELVRETFFDVYYVCWTFLWFREFFQRLNF